MVDKLEHDGTSEASRAVLADKVTHESLNQILAELAALKGQYTGISAQPYTSCSGLTDDNVCAEMPTRRQAVELIGGAALIDLAKGFIAVYYADAAWANFFQAFAWYPLVFLAIATLPFAWAWRVLEYVRRQIAP